MSCDSNLKVVLLLFWLISDAAAICVSLGIYVRDSVLRFIHLVFSHSQFDTNGDGQISTAELREAMKKLLGQQVRSCWERMSFQSCFLFESWLLLCVLCPKHSHRLFSGWTQRSGGHPTRHRPERRWACRL